MRDENAPILRIPLFWSTGRLLKRCAALGMLTAVPLVLLTLPVLWINGVLWLVALAAALVAVFLIVRALLLREITAALRENGPFIEIDGGAIYFPERLAARHSLPRRVPLADLKVRSWYARSPFNNGHGHYPLAGYLELVGGGVDVLLEPGDQSGAVLQLEKNDWDALIARLRGRKPVRVEGAALVRAALALRERRSDDARRTSATGATDATEQKNAETGAGSAKATEPSAAQSMDRLARVRAAMEQGKAARTVGLTPPRETASKLPPKASAETPSDHPTEATIRSLLFYGGLKQVPEGLLDYVRNWRSPSGETLLHDPASNRAVAVLLEAGLDPGARDNQGRTPLMVYERTALANRTLIEAGSSLDAVCNKGHTVVWHQIAPLGGGYGGPDYSGVEALFAAGLPPPTPVEAEVLKQMAREDVTAAAEYSASVTFARWLDQVARGPSDKRIRP